MSFLGVLESVRHRLMGGDPQVTPPMPTSFDVQRHVVIDGQTVRLVLSSTEAHRIAQTEPCFSYNVISMDPRFGEYSPPTADLYREDVPGSLEEVTLPNGDTIQRAGLLKRRPVEQPMDFMVEVRAYTDDLLWRARLSQFVWDVFPARTYLRVPQEDGSWRSWNMTHLDFRRDPGSGFPADGREGLTHDDVLIWTYTVKGFLDTTKKTHLQPLPKTAETTYEPMQKDSE